MSIWYLSSLKSPLCPINGCSVLYELGQAGNAWIFLPLSTEHNIPKTALGKTLNDQVACVVKQKLVNLLTLIRVDKEHHLRTGAPAAWHGQN